MIWGFVMKFSYCVLQHIDWICSNPPPLNIPTAKKSRYIWIVDLPQKRHNVSLFLCEKIGHPTTRSTQVQLSQRCRWFSTNEALALPEERPQSGFQPAQLTTSGGWALPLGRLLYLTQHISIPWPLAMFLSWQGAFSHIWEAYFDRYLEFPSFPEPGKIDISGSPLGSGSSARLDGRMREVVLSKVSGQGCSLGCQSYICSPNLDHILKVLFGPYQKNKIVLTKLSRLGYVSKPLRSNPLGNIPSL